jgi:hypothetical protein
MTTKAQREAAALRELKHALERLWSAGSFEIDDVWPVVRSWAKKRGSE